VSVEPSKPFGTKPFGTIQMLKQMTDILLLSTCIDIMDTVH